MKKIFIGFSILIITLVSILYLVSSSRNDNSKQVVVPESSHWLMLHRKSGQEFLYFGIAGDVNNSKIVRKFQVKSGISGESPTPLPKLLGRKYWILTHKESSMDNPDTAPYFMRLNIPADGQWPYGPVPYEECRDNLTGENKQCDWMIPGYFGLHGVGEDSSKLSKTDPGSSGCIRHSNDDITYLYNLLDPDKEEIRYYIEDI